MQGSRFVSLAVFSVLVLCSLTAGATTVTFTATCPTCYTYYTTYTDAATGTTFATATGGSDLTGMDYYGTGTYPADFLIGATDAFSVNNTLTITFPSPVSYFQINLGSFSGGQFTLTASDGATGTVNPPAPFNLATYSLFDPSGVTWLTIDTPANDTWVITQLGYTAAPEPGTLSLLAGAGLALAGRLRRKFMV